MRHDLNSTRYKPDVIAKTRPDWQQIPTNVALLLLLLGTLCLPAVRSNATVEPELTTAIRHKNFQRVQTLLSEGVDVNERDEGDEQTPLMWAVRTGDITVVRGLLDHGASVNAQDDNGKTALMFAMEKGYHNIARLLIERGARAPLSHAARQTATHLAGARVRPVTRRTSRSFARRSWDPTRSAEPVPAASRTLTRR